MLTIIGGVVIGIIILVILGTALELWLDKVRPFRD